MTQKRGKKTITIDGETKTIAEWAAQHNMPYEAVRNRIVALGWPPKIALHTPITKYKSK